MATQIDCFSNVYRKELPSKLTKLWLNDVLYFLQTRLIMRNRTRKEAARILAEEEEAKKPKIIPHWKKSYLENLQKMQELEEEENNPEENPTTADDEGDNEVQTDEDIEEELDKFEGSPKKILKRDSSVYSDIPEDVVQDIQAEQEIEEEIEEKEAGNDMTTVKLHINYEKGCSVNELAEVLQNQWHSNFKDYSIQRIKNGQDFDIFSVSLKVPKTILPEHYFVYKGRKPSDTRFRNLVLLEQESFWT